MNPKLDIDYSTTNRMHESMIDWVKEEATQLDRHLSWDEARDLLRTKLDQAGCPMRTDGHEVLSAWLAATNLPVYSWNVIEPEGVAWSNYETEEDAHDAVSLYMKNIGVRELDYTLTDPSYAEES